TTFASTGVGAIQSASSSYLLLSPLTRRTRELFNRFSPEPPKSQRRKDKVTHDPSIERTIEIEAQHKQQWKDQVRDRSDNPHRVLCLLILPGAKIGFNDSTRSTNAGDDENQVN